MSRRSAALGLTVAAALTSACGVTHATQTTAPTTRAAATPSASVAATLEATPNPPQVTVVAAGAAADPTGTLGIAIVRNDDPARGLTGGTVVITATSSNGIAPVTATVQISGLVPGATQGVTAPLALPSNFVLTSVSATATPGGFGSYTDPFTAGPAAFAVQEQQPTVTTSVISASPTTQHAEVVVVCVDSSGTILGGGSAAVSPSGGETRQISIPIAIQNTPDRCEAYARPA